MYRYIKSSSEAIPTISSVEDLMEELEYGKYRHYGLRGAHEEDLEVLSRGYLDPSHVWEDGEYTDEVLSGTSALDVTDTMSEVEILDCYKMCKSAYNFHNGTVLLLGDNSYEYGDDYGEVLLGSNGYGADVVAFVDLD